MRSDALLKGLFPSTTLPTHEITSIAQSAQHADENSIFVCIRGSLADGHDFAHRAYENGCRIFVCERPIDLPLDACVLICKSAREALAHLACEMFDHPSRRLHVVGITGTKGKTTTASLLFEILNQNSIPTGYIGTNGIRYHDVEVPSINTTPDPVTLQKTLSEMHANGIRVVVLEVSSQAIMQERVAGIRFETVVFTNLSPDHIGEREHPSFEHYRDTKHRLFTDFSPTTAVWNVDDPAVMLMRQACTAKRQITCSTTTKSADFAVHSIKNADFPNHLETSFFLCKDASEIFVTLPLLGECNAENALLASSVAISVFNLSLGDIAHALENACVRGRSECIPLHSGAVAVIDYAHNGESMKRILSSLRELSPARLICLFGSVGERSEMRRAELGSIAGEWCDLLILTSDNPGHEDPERILSEIASAVEPFGTPYLKITDREEAIRAALELARAGDILLLAGKGHERYQLVGSEKRPFCEQEIIERYERDQSVMAMQ